MNFRALQAMGQAWLRPCAANNRHSGMQEVIHTVIIHDSPSLLTISHYNRWVE